MLKRTQKKIDRVLAVQKGYFIDSSNEIASRNLHFMKMVGYAVILTYGVYLAVTFLFFRRRLISPWYGLIVPILILFLLYANRKLKSGHYSAKQTQRVTLLLYAVLMAYVIVMSIFPHPDMPSVYYPLFLLVAPVLFILPAHQHLMMTISSLGIFYFLVFNFKAPACFSHELFEATTSAAFSVVVIIFMTQFRLQSDSLKEKYYKLSRMDALTGIVNKSAGLESAQEYLANMGENESCAVLFIDIDSFKHYNDTFGHLQGDQMLKSIGATLSSLCRKDDIVSRFGGDEFIILLKDIQTKEMAIQKAQRMIDAVGKMNPDGKEHMTLSIGVCYGAHQYATIEDMVQRADIALYQAKSCNKNCYAVYSEQMVGIPHDV